MPSELTSGMPIQALLDANDRNRFTFACSEAVRKVVFRAPVSEVGMGFNCSYAFFTVPEAPITGYCVEIRFDRRGLFYGETLAAAADWICSAAGIEPLDAPSGAFDAVYSTWYAYLQDVRADDKAMWMVTAIPLPMGSHRENPENRLPEVVKFCDFASAGNTWDASSSYRVWLPARK